MAAAMIAATDRITHRFHPCIRKLMVMLIINAIRRIVSKGENVMNVVAPGRDCTQRTPLSIHQADSPASCISSRLKPSNGR